LHIFSSLVVVLFSGDLDKTIVPNVSTLRSISYGQNSMKVFKASGIGTGLSVPYKQPKYEGNMRVISAFEDAIHSQEPPTPTPKQ
jgi:hypothetical protein